MTLIIGLIILAAIVLMLTGGILWMLLDKIATRQHLSGPMELLREYLPEPTVATPRGLNRAIKDKIRSAYIPDATGKRAMSLIVLRLRPEDLGVLKAAYGLEPYVASLAAYHQKIAFRKNWKLPRDLSLAVVRFVADPGRQPMRPVLDAASSVAALPERTLPFGDQHQRSTGEVRTVDQSRNTPAGDGHGQTGTEQGARLVGPGVDRVFSPSDAPVSIGRSSTNTVVIEGETVHRQHARLDYDGGNWVLVPVNFGNSTTVDGSRITGPALISSQASLSFGDSGGFTFSPTP